MLTVPAHIALMKQMVIILTLFTKNFLNIYREIILNVHLHPANIFIFIEIRGIFIETFHSTFVFKTIRNYLIKALRVDYQLDIIEH